MRFVREVDLFWRRQAAASSRMPFAENALCVKQSTYGLRGRGFSGRRC